MREVRCKKCNKLLFKGVLKKDSEVEIKCPRCGVVMHIIGEIDKK